jgi:bifunctional UDP-N-acetylglucosamine pyrophosphorylase / glucosamine-1-phosphate N-acetyltransferase
VTTAAVVLAAGKSTRFKSGRHKVLHCAAGWTMLRWVLEALRGCGLERVVVVVGCQEDAVRAEAEAAGLDGLVTVTQAEQRGTGHAVRQAVEAGALDGFDTVLVVPGDAPLLTTQLLRSVVEARGDAAVAMLTAVLEDPTGYGRVVRGADGRVRRIVEHRDASEAERRITEVSALVYAFARDLLAAQVQLLSTGNQQGEEYLPDVVAPLVAAGVATVPAPAELVAGVNDRAELARAAAVLRWRILDRHMREGVTVVDPAATYVDVGVEIAPDAVLLPGAHLEGTTVIAAGATIGPNTRLVDTRVAEHATVAYSVAVGASIGPEVAVGPFSYLRPGTCLEAGAKAGAFVEIKESTIGEGSKVPHLSYIGDTTIGRGTNIGAATVTVNYDGFAKHKTVIGDGVRIGSDTMLIAPLQIGDHAYTGAGSAITQDVPEGALAIERGEQRIVPGYAERKSRRAGG